ncbi:uncharacterized protein LOC105631831 isoform X5 [Jatropha curcas]|uniref:uncharacterized protein LOC105631831 isoform X5 n=1 Tax=Jatropha curcas TaxID=180498 RepID=UPI0005FB895A|nr:uncharacterized protein LOC105631831 isoform X5 [Jatropha curcas]
MVCSVGSGRMAVMARLLAAGSLSQTIGDEIGQQKLSAQCIFRELHEADEANLLNEEDMHVFGLRPMADPLDLVCCNACKKPVKTSQYAAHTATPVTEQERPVSTNADDVAASESHLKVQPGNLSCFSMHTKRNLTCVDVASIMDGKGVSPENTDHSACVMPPPTKRSKLISSQHLSLSNHPEAVSGLTKITSSQDTFTCRDFHLQSTSGSDMPNDCIVSKFPARAHEHCLLSKDIPVPLATKIYYSQRNNRLRLAIAHMYHEASAKGRFSNVMSPEVSEETIIQLPASSDRGCSRKQVDDLYKKRETSICKPDQILAQSSEVCLDTSANFSHQFPVDNIPRPQTAPIGLLRNKYLSQPYSFAGNSGQSLGNMQQPSGSVPVL